MPRAISLDYETYYKKSGVDAFSVTDLGYYKYTRDPRCDVYLISVCDGREVWAGHPRDFNFDSLRDFEHVVAHNAAFDQEVSLAGGERGLIPSFVGQLDWKCSANMGVFLWGQRSLKDCVRLGLGVDLEKDVRDRASGKTWDDMVREGWSEDMLRYGRRDAQLCWQLWDKYSSKWPESEQRLSRLTIEQGRHGVRIDVARLDHYIEVMQRIIFNATANLPWVARGRKPGSTLGIAEECRTFGIPNPPVKQDDEDAAAEWEAEFSPRYPWVMALRNLRKAKKALAFFETMRLRVRSDETLPFSLKYGGAHTLRWSGDSGLSLHNLPKSPFFVRADYTFEFDQKLLMAYDKAFDRGQPIPGIIEMIDQRGLLIARPGMKLAPTDLAQIEPRVLHHQVGDTEILAQVSAGMSIYESHARRTMKWTGGELKVENKPEYNRAKMRELAFGYGSGWEKAVASSWKYDVDLTEGDEEAALKVAVDGKVHLRAGSPGKWVYGSAPEGSSVKVDPNLNPATIQRVIFVEKMDYRTKKLRLEVQSVYGQHARAEIKDYRTSNDKIVNLWKDLEQMLRDSVGCDLELELPSGRSLIYRDVKKSVRKVLDKETGEYEERYVLTALVGGKRKITYGSKLCENLIQAIARDVFAHNWLLLDDAGIRVLFTVHDEAVPEVPQDFDTKIITKLMSTTPSWLAGCPVGAETKETQRYLK